MTEASLPSYEALFEQAACGLLITDSRGNIKRVNATLCGWLGYAATDLVDKKRLSDLLTMGGKVFHQTHWSPLLQIQHSLAEVKLDIVHRDGHTVPMLLNAIRRERDEGIFDEIAAIVVMDRHKYERELLAARKNAEAAEERLRELNHELSQADRQKDEFLATLAHELRNPLAPMRNTLELLKYKKFIDPSILEFHEVLERQLTQMTLLVDDLLEVSRVTQGKLRLRKEQVNLKDILRAAIESTAPIIKHFSHELIADVPKQAIFLDADPLRLTQAITNLLTNAAKYTPDHGEIWLTATEANGVCSISIRDSGIGIAPENLSQVFKMFSQVTAPLDRAEGGLGVGLALVKGMVELHGGKIAAHSEGLGCGSEFIIQLPTLTMDQLNTPENPNVDKTNRPSREIENSTRHKVLVVDDNRDAANSLARILKLFGQEVAIAYDGQNAVQIAAEFLADIIILDIGLPEMNGYEVARIIRQSSWGSKIFLIAVTGWGQAEDKLLAKNAGFDVHLTKPVDPAELKAILSQHAHYAAQPINS